jgi:hypothetical protein
MKGRIGEARTNIYDKSMTDLLIHVMKPNFFTKLPKLNPSTLSIYFSSNLLALIIIKYFFNVGAMEPH